MRAAAVIREELDACDSERRELDNHITAMREQLAGLNAKAKALEIEFQAADAAEKQAAAGQQ